MAAPTLQAEGAIAAVTTGNLTPTLPAHATNDILVVVMSAWVPNTTTGANTVAAPSGWTKLLSDTVITSSLIDGEWAIFWKRAASGSEANPTFTRPTGWDTGTDTNWSARAYVIRGCITTGDPWDAAVKSALYSTANQALPAVTVSGSERMVLQGWSCSDNQATTGQPTSSGWTSGTLTNSTTGTDAGFNTLRKDNVSASTNADATTIPAPVQGRYIYFGISFKPPASVTTPVSMVAVGVAVAGMTTSTTFARTLPVTALGVVTLTTALLTSLSLAATAVVVVALSRTLTYVRALSAIALASPTLSKRMSVTLGATATGVSALAKRMAQTLSAVALAVPVLATALRASVTMPSSALGAAALAQAATYARTLAASVIGLAVVATQYIAGQSVAARVWRSLGVKIGLDL